MTGEYCERCGQYECRCDRRSEEYECGKCGYVPTERELRGGTCPNCARASERGNPPSREPK